MRRGLVLKLFLVVIAALCWVGSASAQQLRYFPDFSSGAGNLQLNGGAHLATWSSQKVLRLTDGYAGVGTFHPENTTSWFKIQQPVNQGFTTYFKFQIHNAYICCNPADGLAFVIQSSAPTARGAGNGGLGYQGIPNSLAVEFDTFQNLNYADPNANHVAVQSCGSNPNSPDHTNPPPIGTGCLVGSGINPNITQHLGVTCTSGPCTDGTTHEVVIEYDAPASGAGNGALTVWIDPVFVSGTHTPVSTAVKAINALPYNIDIRQNPQGITLAGGTSAWVGFSASQTNDPEAHDILAWEFSSFSQTQVQQQIPPGGVPAMYNFGQNDTIVTYFPGFTNNGCDGMSPKNPCLMTVVATPWNPTVFYNQRLAHTPFDNQQCVTYEGTGGNCIVYSITCQTANNPNQNVTCPASLPGTCTFLGDPTCIQFSTSFYTLENVTATNTKYPKTDPIGSNNWMNIEVFYNPNVLDGRGGGTSGTPSDFVFTYNPKLP
jgi:legume-like lectin family protein